MSQNKLYDMSSACGYLAVPEHVTNSRQRHLPDNAGHTDTKDDFYERHAGQALNAG